MRERMEDAEVHPGGRARDDDPDERAALPPEPSLLALFGEPDAARGPGDDQGAQHVDAPTREPRREPRSVEPVPAIASIATESADAPQSAFLLSSTRKSAMKKSSPSRRCRGGIDGRAFRGSSSTTNCSCSRPSTGGRPRGRRLAKDLDLTEAVETVSTLRAHAHVSPGALQAAGAAPPHPLHRTPGRPPKGGEGRAVVGELDDVVVVVVALQVDRGHARGGAEVVEDVALCRRAPT